MKFQRDTNHRSLSRSSSGVILGAAKNIMTSYDRLGTTSTYGSDLEDEMTASNSSKGLPKNVATPLMEYYKTRDRYPNTIQKTSQFAPPGLKTIMTPIIKKSLDGGENLYSSVSNGAKYSVLTPRRHVSSDLPSIIEKLPPSMSRTKLADIATYQNGDKHTFNDSHFYLGFSSSKRKELASSMKLPKEFTNEVYRDSESVNGLIDKPNHIGQ